MIDGIPYSSDEGEIIHYLFNDVLVNYIGIPGAYMTERPELLLGVRGKVVRISTTERLVATLDLTEHIKAISSHPVYSGDFTYPSGSIEYSPEKKQELDDLNKKVKLIAGKLAISFGFALYNYFNDPGLNFLKIDRVNGFCDITLMTLGALGHRNLVSGGQHLYLEAETYAAINENDLDARLLLDRNLFYFISSIALEHESPSMIEAIEILKPFQLFNGRVTDNFMPQFSAIFMNPNVRRLLNEFNIFPSEEEQRNDIQVEINNFLRAQSHSTGMSLGEVK